MSFLLLCNLLLLIDHISHTVNAHTSESLETWIQTPTWLNHLTSETLRFPPAGPGEASPVLHYSQAVFLDDSTTDLNATKLTRPVPNTTSSAKALTEV